MDSLSDLSENLRKSRHSDHSIACQGLRQDLNTESRNSKKVVDERDHASLRSTRGAAENVDVGQAVDTQQCSIGTRASQSFQHSNQSLTHEMLALMFKRMHEDLDGVIARSRAVFANTHAAKNERAAMALRHQLGYLLTTRFHKTGDLKDLEEAIAHIRTNLLVQPVGEASRSISLKNLAKCLKDRFEKLGDLKDLEEGIGYSREALLLVERGLEVRSILADSLFCRFKRLGERVDLEEAIDHYQANLIQFPDDSDRMSSLTSLGNALLLRFEQMGLSSDLELTISVYRDAHVLISSHSPHRGTSLTNLANALLLRFNRQGALTDLEEVIELFYDALRLRPPGHLNRLMSLTNIAAALLTRYDRLASLADLHDAIKYLVEAVSTPAPDQPDRFACFIDLAVALSRRFRLNGDMRDLDKSISYCREALDLRPLENSAERVILTNLAAFLGHRFDHQGDVADLEDSIRCQRDAIIHLPPSHIDRVPYLDRLAHALLSRFRLYGELGDLQEGIACHQESLLLSSPGDPKRPQLLCSVANSLITRYGLTRNSADLEDGIGYLRNALSLNLVGDPRRASSLTSVARGLFIRHKNLGCPESLNQAIGYLREALSLQSASTPTDWNTLFHLGCCLVAQYHLNQDQNDLEEAVDYHKQAFLILPADHPQTIEVTSMLAEAYLAYRTLPGGEQKVEEARTILQNAIDHPTASVHSRFRLSLQWVTTLEGVRRLQAYRKCLDLADCYVSVRAPISSRHKLVYSSIPPHLVSEAAAHAINVGQLDAAVELLEQGRTILWSQMGRYRTPLDTLREADGALATAFGRLCLRIEQSAVSSDFEDRSRRSLEDETSEYRKLMDEWNRLLQDIRSLRGLEYFLKATPFKTLRNVAIYGPLIVINVDRLRSDAIILVGTENISLVPLPNATPAHIDHLVKQFAHLLRLNPGRSRESKMIAILRTLWEDIVRPVVDQLQYAGVAKGSRIWWCPTSKLSHLPLHAAGPYRRPGLDLPDLFVSSYTPTLSALLRSSATISPAPRPPSILLVAQPDTPGQQVITSVQAEVQSIRNVATSVDLLLSSDGNHEAVIAGLQRHRWVHFACHGSQDLREPFRSHFHLYDKPLSLLDIIQARLPHAEFAFLAACHSAAGDGKAPDEIIHLAAGLQFSGFRSVIGTLYPMADVDGPVVAEEVYKYLFRRVRPDSTEDSLVDFRDAAVALNQATRVLRERGVPVDRWINFVHIGA